jgi:hypothetical protein
MSGCGDGNPDVVEHAELRASSRSLKSSAGKTSSPAPGLGGRVHRQIAWAKLRSLRDGAAIASKSWRVELKVPMGDETDQKARKSRSKV